MSVHKLMCIDWIIILNKEHFVERVSQQLCLFQLGRLGNLMINWLCSCLLKIVIGVFLKSFQTFQHSYQFIDRSKVRIYGIKSNTELEKNCCGFCHYHPKIRFTTGLLSQWKGLNCSFLVVPMRFGNLHFIMLLYRCVLRMFLQRTRHCKF